MAEYDGVHSEPYKVRGIEYVRLWWYSGKGSDRPTKSLGQASKLTKSKIAQARRQKEAELAKAPGRIGAGATPTWGAWREQYKEMRSDLSESSV